MKQQRRNKLAIILDILNALHQPLTKATIRRQTQLTSKQFANYLQILTRKELIQTINTKDKTTSITYTYYIKTEKGNKLAKKSNN